MRRLFFYMIISGVLSVSLRGQENTIFKGKILFLSSGKTPAVGVEVSGNVEGVGRAGSIYTADDGSYKLIFPKAVAGKPVRLMIGNTDGNGKILELVNNREVSNFRVPERTDDEFEIIVCERGARDTVAERYYKILKSSSELELKKIKDAIDNLLAQSQKDDQRISMLSDKMLALRQRSDSVMMYREAFRLASINKDNATKRVLEYLALLDQGKLIREARKVPGIEGVANHVGEGTLFYEAVKDLETRAEASRRVFEYKDAIRYYDTIIYKMKKREVPPLKKAPYYFKIANVFLDDGNYTAALGYQQKGIDLQEEVLGSGHPDLAAAYNNITATYQFLGQYKKAVGYHQKAIRIQEATLDPKHPDLATAYGNIGTTYQFLSRYKKALEYQQKAIAIREAILPPKHPSLGATYTSIAITYMKMKDLESALRFQEKCLTIFKEVLPEDHPYQKKALNTLAEIYYNSKDYQKAIAIYQKLVKTFPEIKKSGFYNNIGLTYAKNKQFKEAQTAFSKYEKLFPKKGATYRNWAVYYALQNEKEKALNNVKKAVSLGYDNAEWLQTDESMQLLRKEKAFKKIIRKLGKKGKK